MRTHYYYASVAIVTLFVAVSACGGGDDCPGTSLAVSIGELERPGVNRIECVGVSTAEISECASGTSRATAEVDHTCGGYVLRLKDIGGEVLFHMHAGSTDVRVEIVDASDDIGAERENIRVLSGSLQMASVPDALESRHAGTFEFELESGSLRGSYDTYGFQDGPWFLANTIRPLRDEEALSLALGGGAGNGRLSAFLLSIPGYENAVASAILDGDVLFGVNLSERGIGAASVFPAYLSGGPLVDADSDPANNFSGTASMSVRLEQPVGELAGAKIDGEFLGGSQAASMRAPLLLSPDGDTLLVDLVAVRSEVTVGDGGLVDGRLGGAISGEAVESAMLPAFESSFARTIDRQCGGGVCPSGSAGEYLLAMFDDNSDGAITLAEIRSGSAALMLDVDAFDGSKPGADGEVDSLSIGLGFTAIAARVDGQP